MRYSSNVGVKVFSEVGLPLYGVLGSSPPIAPPPISEGGPFELGKNGAIE